MGHSTISKFFVISGVMLIVLNSLVGLIFNSYRTFNWVASDLIIIINIIILTYTANISIRDAFKIFLYFFNGILLLSAFICAALMDNHLKDNILLSIILGIQTMQLLMTVIIKFTNTSKS